MLTAEISVQAADGSRERFPLLKDRITIGRSRIVFRVLAQAAGGGSPARREPATQRHDMGGFWGPAE